MLSVEDKCPIPFSQRPLNEYESLKNSCFFSWPTLDLKNFLFKLVTVWLATSVIVTPVIYDIFSALKAPGKFIMLDVAFSNFILLGILVRLYLGWSYIVKRLLSATVFYEESGWYDGQIWIKPSRILIQDRLTGTYEVIPLLKIISKILMITAILLFIEVILFVCL